MKTLPLAVTTVLGASVLSARRVAGSILSSGLALLLFAGLASHTVPMQAQADESEFAGQTVVELPPTPSDADAKKVPSFSINNILVGLPGEHTTAAAYITATSKHGFTGIVNFTCQLETKTKTATPPECSMYPASKNLPSDGYTQPQILIYGLGTKVPADPTTSGKSNWMGIGVGGGSAVLACALLFGVPARRRGWQKMLSAMLLLVAVSSLTACVTTPKMITAGYYTFKVTGVSATDSSIKATGTVKVSVL